jgi:rubrerythrin
MPVVTVADVLERARRFEEMLAEYYSGLAQSTTREGVRLLTDYMSRHRQRIDAELAELTPEQARHIRSMPIHYKPHAADCHCFEGMELPPDAPAALVLDNAICLDGCLIALYRQAAAQVPDAESQAFFQAMIRCEERDAIELKKIKAMDYF